MAISNNNKYRIKRSAEYEEEMRYLIRDLKIFSDYSQIITVSAIIGYNNGLFVPIKTQASDAVQMTFFSSKNQDIMNLIAFAHEKKQSILKTDDKYTIFESYANGGFPLLIKKLGVDFIDKGKNNRQVILEKYFELLLNNGFKI